MLLNQSYKLFIQEDAVVSDHKSSENAFNEIEVKYCRIAEWNVALLGRDRKLGRSVHSNLLSRVQCSGQLSITAATMKQ